MGDMNAIDEMGEIHDIDKIGEKDGMDRRKKCIIADIDKIVLK